MLSLSAHVYIPPNPSTSRALRASTTCLDSAYMHPEGWAALRGRRDSGRRAALESAVEAGGRAVGVVDLPHGGRA